MRFGLTQLLQPLLVKAVSQEEVAYAAGQALGRSEACAAGARLRPVRHLLLLLLLWWRLLLAEEAVAGAGSLMAHWPLPLQKLPSASTGALLWQGPASWSIEHRHQPSDCAQGSWSYSSPLQICAALLLSPGVQTVAGHAQPAG